MDKANPAAETHALSPLKGGADYTLELQADMLALNADDGHTVLMLPREEAARYLRFDRDLRRGRVIEFRLLGGLRSMRFVCSPSAVTGVVGWLPRGGKSVLSSRTLLLLFSGIAGLFWEPTRILGGAILLIGMLNLALLQRNLSILNAVVCGGGALVALFGPSFGVIGGPPAASFLYGALLALTAIEYLGYTGPNRAIFEARLAAVRADEGTHNSTLVWRVVVAVWAAALAFGGLAGALFFFPPANSASPQAIEDRLIFLIAALVLGATVPLLWRRARPPYAQALIAAQFLIAVLTVYVWGLASALYGGTPVDYTRGVFAAATANSTQPLFAVPLLVLEIAFRRWFVRAAEREAAEAD